MAQLILGSKEAPVTLSFAKLFEPQPGYDKSKNEYSTQILIDKSDKANVLALENAINEAVNEAVENKRITKALAGHRDFWNPLRDGDEHASLRDDGKRDYLKGQYFLSAKVPEYNASGKLNTPPVVYDRYGQVLNRKDADKFNEEVYSGRKAIVCLNVYAYGTGKGGVSAGLKYVVLREDGENLGSGTGLDKNLIDDFADVVESDDLR